MDLPFQTFIIPGLSWSWAAKVVQKAFTVAAVTVQAIIIADTAFAAVLLRLACI
jgi:hypothetical protein